MLCLLARRLWLRREGMVSCVMKGLFGGMLEVGWRLGIVSVELYRRHVMFNPHNHLYSPELKPPHQPFHNHVPLPKPPPRHPPPFNPHPIPSPSPPLLIPIKPTSLPHRRPPPLQNPRPRHPKLIPDDVDMLHHHPSPRLPLPLLFLLPPRLRLWCFVIVIVVFGRGGGLFLARGLVGWWVLGLWCGLGMW